MSSVGVRELKEHASEIVRRVREDGETIDVTYRGEIVATIAPKRTLPPDDDRAFWEEQRALVRAIGERMGSEPVDVVTLVDLERMEVSPDDEELPPMGPMNS
jgi:prevent-host-death family protein